MLSLTCFDMVCSNFTINTRDANDRRAHLNIVHSSVTVEIDSDSLEVVQYRDKLNGIEARDEILFVESESVFAHSSGRTCLFVMFERTSKDKQLIVLVKTFNLNVTIDNILIWIGSNCVVNGCEMV